ncbi:hypothetical protein PC123_g3124 [Phytophthora cactorum]|nr:hypothetical protein PC123_g3124 [Phytophthora cactorum]
MDVILAQLSPRELEAHCRDAMKTQLMVMQRALNDAVDAANRAGEVQLASQKLSITLFEDGSDLSSALLVSTWLRDELAQSLERVMTRALAKSGKEVCAAPVKRPSSPRATSAIPQSRDPTAQKKCKSNAPTAEEASVKKRKSPLSTTIERAPKSSAKAPEVVKKPPLSPRHWKLMLVQHFNIAHKNLDPNIIIDQIEALDTLSAVAGMAISIMQHGDPQMKRHWVQKFRDNIADAQEQFPDSTGAFSGHINALSKIISSFPLTIREGQQLRTRLRTALKEADKTVRDLTALLLDRVTHFKDNKKLPKRKQKLQAWLEKMDQDPQQMSSKRHPLASDANAKASKSLEKKQVTPGRTNGKSIPPRPKTSEETPPHLPQKHEKRLRPSNTIISAEQPSPSSSDTEPTQSVLCIKVEVSE